MLKQILEAFGVDWISDEIEEVFRKRRERREEELAAWRQIRDKLRQQFEETNRTRTTFLPMANPGELFFGCSRLPEKAQLLHQIKHFRRVMAEQALMEGGESVGA